MSYAFYMAMFTTMVVSIIGYVTVMGFGIKTPDDVNTLVYNYPIFFGYTIGLKSHVKKLRQLM